MGGYCLRGCFLASFRCPLCVTCNWNCINLGPGSVGLHSFILQSARLNHATGGVADDGDDQVHVVFPLL